MASAYVYGNVVRKNDYVYADDYNAQRREREEYYDREARHERARRKVQAANRSRQYALRMDMPSLAILTVALIVALFFLVNYLQLQSSITTSLKTIEAQEKVLEELKSENDATEIRIKSSVNLEHIYEVATNELGMVYANKDQVIEYKRTENEYVRQYDDIK